jgi:hypothetical protein
MRCKYEHPLSQHIPHKPMIILQMACKSTNNSLQSSFGSCLLEKIFFALLYKHYLHIFYITKISLVVEDTLKNRANNVATTNNLYVMFVGCAIV